MIFAWFIALVVPVLAVLGGPWLVGHLDPGRETAMGDPMLLLIQFFLAAAPLVALAIFALVGRARPGAIRGSAVMSGLVTLALWGWYHAGAEGLEPDWVGHVLLASPIIIALLAVIFYWVAARLE